MTGPPIGVVPISATAHSAITRPRIDSVAVSSSRLAPRDMKATLAAPTAARTVSSSQNSGATAAPTSVSPNAPAATTTARSPGAARPATSTPPISAPPPNAAVR